MFFRKKSKRVEPPVAVSQPVRPAAIPVMDAAGEPDLRGLGRVLWRKKTTILLFTVVAAGAAFVVVNSITPRYRSESRLLLESRESVFMRAEADKSATDRANLDPEAVTSQIQLVLSRDLAHDVIKKEKLDQLPEFDPTIGGMSLTRTLLSLFGMARNVNALSPDERTLEAYYDRINVFAVEKSRVIGVDFSSSNPDLAARVANSIAETYLKLQQSAKTDQTRAASTWLATEIEKMRTKVAAAEAKIEEYRARSNLFVGSNNSSLPSQQLTEINSQIAAARGQKADLEARARQLHDLVRSGKPVDSSDIANSESMRRLTEQGNALRSQLAEQSTTLLSQHPRIKELNAQIAQIERAKRVEGERLARQLDNDAKLAGDRLQTLTASLDQVKKLASQSNEQDLQLRALERDAKSQRDILESYLTKYSEASARDNVNAAPPEARIISRATPAIKPAYPKKAPTVLIAAFAAFALSAGFIVTGALLAPPLAPAGVAYSYNYAPPPLPLPRMASPPLMPEATAQGMPPLRVTTVEHLAQGLHQAGDNGRRVVVLGSTRNTGTTYTAITLARTLGREASVVLVDMAFGAPNVSVISTDPNAPGIAELIRGTASFGEVITGEQYSPVHLIATGNVGADGPAFAASPMLPTIIEALAQSYNFVIIDAGSAADVAIDRFAPLGQRTVLVSADPADGDTQTARQNLAMIGVTDITLVAGAAQHAAA